jgi:hypothetical protein
MWDNFEEVQHIITSLGNEIVEVDSWRKLPFGERISIYHNFSGGESGYVVPESQIMNINTPPPDGEIFVTLKELEDEFSLNNFGDSELENSIKSFARYAYNLRVGSFPTGFRRRPHFFQGHF